MIDTSTLSYRRSGSSSGVSIFVHGSDGRKIFHGPLPRYRSRGTSANAANSRGENGRVDPLLPSSRTNSAYRRRAASIPAMMENRNNTVVCRRLSARYQMQERFLSRSGNSIGSAIEITECRLEVLWLPRAPISSCRKPCTADGAEEDDPARQQSLCREKRKAPSGNSTSAERAQRS